MMTPLKNQLDPQLFFRCVEDSNEAIMISDRSGKLVYVNPAWCKIYGYSKDEAIGQTPALLHSGIQPSEFYRTMWEQILDPRKGSWKGELINRAKDGTLVPVLLTITPYRNADGDIRGYMAMALDVTQKKELEATVAHQDRLASIGLLASGLAHEIGTPLGVVRGRAEFLAMKAETTQDAFVKKNLEVITSEIDRISKLIRSLLRVSRGFGEVHLQSLALLPVVEEVIALIGQNFRTESVLTHVEIPGDLAVLADRGRMDQVLLNLLMNSFHAIQKAKKEGDSGRNHFLRIAARKVSGTAGKNDRVVIEVEDSGCGISQENQKRIFRPFFTTKDVGEGTGLGLAIVAQLMTEMNGTVSVRSQVGVGTTFSLSLRHAVS